VPHGQHDGDLRPYSRVSRPEKLFFGILIVSTLQRVNVFLTGSRAGPHRTGHKDN
jgi:hypothetical protein